MSSKFEKRGVILAYNLRNLEKGLFFYSNFAYRRIQMDEIKSKSYLCHYLYIMYYAFSSWINN